MGHWFNYNKVENSISISSVEFLAIIPFIRGKNFKVTELLAVKKNKEISLIPKNEPSIWITKNHSIEISHWFEENEFTPIYYAEIDLEGGAIVFNYGRLYVRYPLNQNLKEVTLKLLESLGYFSGNSLWEFCVQHPDELMLDFIHCIEENDITDEFERMLAHSRSSDD